MGDDEVAANLSLKLDGAVPLGSLAATSGAARIPRGASLTLLKAVSSLPRLLLLFARAVCIDRAPVRCGAWPSRKFRVLVGEEPSWLWLSACKGEKPNRIQKEEMLACVTSAVIDVGSEYHSELLIVELL